MNKHSRSHDKPEPTPGGATDHVGTDVSRKREILKRGSKNKMARMKPQLLADGNDNTLLHFIDVSLATPRGVDPRPASTLEKQKLGSESEIHSTDPDLSRVQ